LRAGLGAILGAPPAGAAQLLERFCRLLLAANAETNLTGATDLEQLVLHTLDSLAPLPLIELRSVVVDLGSGAGFPGIPAAIAFPGLSFALVEPRTKRVGFLRTAVSSLELTNVEVIKASAPRVSFAGSKASTVLARALAAAPRAVELGLSLLKVGGVLLLYAGRASKPDEESSLAANHFGGSEIAVVPVEVPYLFKHRHAWILRKIVDVGA
jgi:16S rRNA (guanine527-N7)-methyltransferase